jgi:hypothetical protein
MTKPLDRQEVEARMCEAAASCGANPSCATDPRITVQHATSVALALVEEARRACPGCSYSLARCYDAQNSGRGYIKCCPDCDHRAQEKETR